MELWQEYRTAIVTRYINDTFRQSISFRKNAFIFFKTYFKGFVILFKKYFLKVFFKVYIYTYNGLRFGVYI
jgi:hypothetical protein